MNDQRQTSAYELMNYDLAAVNNFSRRGKGRKIGPDERRKLIKWLGAQPEAVLAFVIFKLLTNFQRQKETLEYSNDKQVEFFVGQFSRAVLDAWIVSQSPDRKSSSSEYEQALASSFRRVSARAKALQGTGHKPARKRAELVKIMPEIVRLHEKDGMSFPAIAQFVNTHVPWFADKKAGKRKVSSEYLRKVYNDHLTEVALARAGAES